MKYLKLYESDEWRRNTTDPDLYDMSLEVDDILLEISDESLPFVQPAFINKNKINVEIVGTPDGRLTYADEFKVTPTVKSTLERLIEYVESKGFRIEIGLYFYNQGEFLEGYYVDVKDGEWFIYSEVDRLHNTISKERRPIDLLEQEPDFIGITIAKNI